MRYSRHHRPGDTPRREQRPPLLPQFLSRHVGGVHGVIPATTNVNAVAFGFVDSAGAPVGTCRMLGNVVAVAASRSAISMLKRAGSAANPYHEVISD